MNKQDIMLGVAIVILIVICTEGILWEYPSLWEEKWECTEWNISGCLDCPVYSDDDLNVTCESGDCYERHVCGKPYPNGSLHWTDCATPVHCTKEIIVRVRE